jgi:hypothetical protein
MQRRVKNLDKMTKEILGLVSAWEEMNGTPFLYAVINSCCHFQLDISRESVIRIESTLKRNSTLR